MLFIINLYKNKKLQESYEQETKKIIEYAKQKASLLSIYPISIFITDENNFIKAKKDYLIQSAKNTGYPIFNKEQYYKLIENEN